MDNITTCCVSLSTVVSPPKPIIFSLVTMSTEASNLLRLSACCWRIKSSTLKTFSSWEETTSALVLIESMGSMMSVRCSDDWRPFFAQLILSRQASLQHQALEDFYRLLQLSPHCGYHRREDLHNARRFESWLAKYGADQESYATNRCSRHRWVRCWAGDASGADFLLGLLCDLLWSDPDKDITGWSENDRGVSFTFGPDVVSRFLQKHDMDLICRAHQVSLLPCKKYGGVLNKHQVVEDGYEFFAKRQLVTLFSAPNYCGEFDNAGAMMSVDDTLLCSFQVSLFIAVILMVCWRFADSETCRKEAEIRWIRRQRTALVIFVPLVIFLEFVCFSQTTATVYNYSTKPLGIQFLEPSTQSHLFISFLASSILRFPLHWTALVSFAKMVGWDVWKIHADVCWEILPAWPISRLHYFGQYLILILDDPQHSSKLSNLTLSSGYPST